MFVCQITPQLCASHLAKWGVWFCAPRALLSNSLLLLPDATFHGLLRAPTWHFLDEVETFTELLDFDRHISMPLSFPTR
jgi:hypothetical protein